MGGNWAEEILILLAGPGWNMGAIFFAIRSTLFSHLLLRGRTIPIPLEWLCLVASVAARGGVSSATRRICSRPDTSFMWIPIAAFEVPLGLWLVIKGVAVQNNSVISGGKSTSAVQCTTVVGRSCRTPFSRNFDAKLGALVGRIVSE